MRRNRRYLDIMVKLLVVFAVAVVIYSVDLVNAEFTSYLNSMANRIFN